MFEVLIRDDLQKFVGYQSARCTPIDVPIMLNANELPWSEGSSDYNRYPMKQPLELLELFAQYYECLEENILITRGSDEAIDLLVRLFCTAGKDSVMICPPTYGIYEICAQLQGASIQKVSLISAQGYEVDLDSIISAYQPETKIIFLCSPNNPTGNCIPISKIKKICDAMANKAIVVVDEAYIEFAECASMINNLSTYSNLVVLRTLSKAFGLAGVRCGILLANSDLINWLKKIIAAYPIPSPCVDIIRERFTQIDLINSYISIIKSEREKLIRKMSQCEEIKLVLPSEANFICFQARDSRSLMSRCLSNGVLIREFRDFLRVSIGTQEENKMFINSLFTSPTRGEAKLIRS